MLTTRQELILRKVVEEHLAAGSPVGSKVLAADGEVTWGPSTVRHELSVLEEFGLLAHPHTSSGRIPTDAGYRYFVDRLLPQTPALRPAPVALDLVRREVDEAMRATTTTLSRVTNLLAVATAPPIETATIRHIEVLLLQPQVLMVVIITSTGGVTKRLFTFQESVDSGLAAWAASYLNERLVGLGLGARMLRQQMADTGLSPREQSFIEEITPAFTQLADTADDSVYFDGAAHLLRGGVDVSELEDLMDLLERRVSLLGVLREALGHREVFVRIGSENEAPALRSLAVVAASYGLPQRSLGTVSVIGPTRMDYAATMSVVRSVAAELSRFVEDVYDDH